MSRTSIDNHYGFSKLLRKIISFTIIMLLIQTVFMPKIFVRVASEPENVIYIEAPQSVDASTTEAFNVTVWFNGAVSDFYAYQVLLTVDDSILTIERAWIPTDNSDWVFYTKQTVPLNPAFYDNDEDGANEGCLLGSTLLQFPGISVSGPKILGIFQLRIIDAPAETTLVIDNTDTIVLDSTLQDVTLSRNNFQISIVGTLQEKEPSNIYVTANPPQTVVGGTVTIEGWISPEKPYKNVHIRILLLLAGSPVTEFTSDIKTNNESRFSLIYNFSNPGRYRIEASWDGDETHAGSKNSTEIIVFEPYTKLKIEFAYQLVLAIGTEGELLPTAPVTVNVTIQNVTNLHEWRVRILFDPVFINVSAVWLPANNVFNLTGIDFNVTGPVFGVENELGYFEIAAELLDEGAGFSGDGTLFQFNIIGLRPTPPQTTTSLQFSKSRILLLNSTNGVIFPVSTELTFLIKGALPVDFIIINPKTEKNEFNFYTTETGIGYKFNVTVRVEKVVNLYGWKVKLTYNSTLLNLSRVIDPRNTPGYVFHGENSSFSFNNYTENSIGVIEANGTLLAGNPFSGNGTMLIIEFEIAFTPDEGRIETSISFDIAGSLYFDGNIWLIPQCIDASYTLIYGEPPITLINTQAITAIIIGVVAIIVVLTVIVRRSRKKEILFEDDVWEIEIDKLY